MFHNNGYSMKRTFKKVNSAERVQIVPRRTRDQHISKDKRTRQLVPFPDM